MSPFLPFAIRAFPISFKVFHKSILQCLFCCLFNSAIPVSCHCFSFINKHIRKQKEGQGLSPSFVGCEGKRNDKFIWNSLWNILVAASVTISGNLQHYTIAFQHKKNPIKTLKWYQYDAISNFPLNTSNNFKLLNPFTFISSILLIVSDKGDVWENSGLRAKLDSGVLFVKHVKQVNMLFWVSKACALNIAILTSEICSKVCLDSSLESVAWWRKRWCCGDLGQHLFLQERNRHIATQV